MKLSLALFTAALLRGAQAAPCDCFCGSGLGVWVDSLTEEECDKPKRFCAGHAIARKLVDDLGDANCVPGGECPDIPCAPVMDDKTVRTHTCPQYMKTEDENDAPVNPYVPKAEKCVMKRKDELLKYQPNFPAGRPDVYIEVELGSTGQRFQFYPHNYPGFGNSKEGAVPLDDPEVYQILYDEQTKYGGSGFKFRYVSRNGPGEWNSCKYSPIAFDLNGNGFVEHIDGDFKIDVSGDGAVEHLAEWFHPEEGILIDVTAGDGTDDGVVDGNNLIGDMAGTYTDGFAKLATYDTDCDNVISGDELKNFKIWMDKNSNTLVDAGEIYELSDFHIVSLSTVHDNLRAHATLDNGEFMMMEDLWFDPFERQRRLEAARAAGRI